MSAGKIRFAFFCFFLIFTLSVLPQNTAAGEIGTAANNSGDTATHSENPDWETVGSGDQILLTGRVRRVGSALFQNIVITDTDGRDWYVGKTEQTALEAYEQQVVTVRGLVFRREMVLANGKKLEDRRELTKLQILE